MKVCFHGNEFKLKNIFGEFSVHLSYTNFLFYTLSRSRWSNIIEDLVVFSQFLIADKDEDDVEMMIKVENEELETTKEVENGEENGEECETEKMEVEETKENTSIVVNS